MTHYELLGIPMDAEQKEIRRAFLAKARELHPDRFLNQSESNEVQGIRDQQFATLRNAYETLFSPRRREQYDRTIRIPEGFADLLTLALGERALARILPRAVKQVRNGEDLLLVVPVESELAHGGGAISIEGFPHELDPLYFPPSVEKIPWGQVKDRGERGENDGEAGDLFILIIPSRS